MELLVLIIDKKLSFEKKTLQNYANSVIQTPCTQEDKKILKYLTLEKARALRTVFVDSQFKGTLIQI